MRPALAAVLLVAACASRPAPEEALRAAEREIEAGDAVRGMRRMFETMERLGVTEASRWDRLGDAALAVDAAIAARAFDRAEALAWPGGLPANVAPLAFPLRGRWLVTQGNRGEWSHRRLADRFAWDLQAIDDAGRVRGDGAGLAAYPTYGAPVFAPADGVVDRTVSTVPDNAGGARNFVHASGNVVVIRHGPGEYSHFMHLAAGTVRVAEGDVVRRGDEIARCGASGNASAPHLHYVLRTGPGSDDPSVPARFDGVRIERRDAVRAAVAGVPEEGDVVERE